MKQKCEHFDCYNLPTMYFAYSEGLLIYCDVHGTLLNKGMYKVCYIDPINQISKEVYIRLIKSLILK